MFLGQYCHSLDSKGRLTVPVKFRELLEQGAYITQGFDSNILLLRTSTFDEISQHVSRMSFTDPRARVLRRLIFSNALPVELDSNGRLLVPQFLRDAADLEEEAFVVGAGLYIEIWSPAAWQAQLDQLNDPAANADRFAGLDLLAGPQELNTD